MTNRHIFRSGATLQEHADDADQRAGGRQASATACLLRPMSADPSRPAPASCLGERPHGAFVRCAPWRTLDGHRHGCDLRRATYKRGTPTGCRRQRPGPWVVFRVAERAGRRGARRRVVGEDGLREGALVVAGRVVGVALGRRDVLVARPLLQPAWQCTSARSPARPTATLSDARPSSWVWGLGGRPLASITVEQAAAAELVDEPLVVAHG